MIRHRHSFFGVSDDVVHWNYLPALEGGHNAVIEYGFASTATRYFLRLKHTPDPVTHHVYLKASGVTPEQMTAGNVLRRYQWDADGGQVVQGAPDKWRVSRSARGSGPVTVKLNTLGGTVVAQMEVWVVWCGVV